VGKMTSRGGGARSPEKPRGRKKKFSPRNIVKKSDFLYTTSPDKASTGVERTEGQPRVWSQPVMGGNRGGETWTEERDEEVYNGWGGAGAVSREYPFSAQETRGAGGGKGLIRKSSIGAPQAEREGKGGKIATVSNSPREFLRRPTTRLRVG